MTAIGQKRPFGPESFGPSCDAHLPTRFGLLFAKGGSPNGSCERRRLFTSINAVMSLLRETVQWQVRDRKLDPLAISSEL